MIKSLRKTLATIAASVSLAFIPVLAPVAVYAEEPNIGGNLACGANLQAETGDCQSDTEEGTDRLQSIITTVVNIFSVLVGLVAVVMIIFGGFKYITSAGESNNMTAARNTIIYAVIGLVIVALAQFIVKFVLNKVNSTP